MTWNRWIPILKDCHWKVICFVFVFVSCVFFNAKSHDSKQVDSTVRELPLKSHLFCAHARPQSSKEPLHLSTKAGWLEITVISCQVNFSFRMHIVSLGIVSLKSDFTSKWVRVSPQTMRRTEDNKRQDFSKKTSKCLERSERCLEMVDIPFSKVPLKITT